MGKIYVVGVDNGFSGAIACIDAHEHRCVELLKMPIINKKAGGSDLDETQIRDILRKFKDVGEVHVYIEKAQVMPKQGLVSSGRYMESHGIVRGICVGLGIPYTITHPQRWKKKMLEGMGKDKSSSIIRVKQLFPSVCLRSSDRCKKDDDNMAEALLIAEYGYRERHHASHPAAA